jgi:hypothetical protein
MASAATFATAATDLADASASLGEAVIDVRQIEGFARTCALDIPPAAAMGDGAARFKIEAIRTGAGGAPATLPKAPVLVPPPPAPKLENVFLLENAMFSERSGGRKRVARWSFTYLTPEQFAHGKRLGIICATDDGRVKGLIKQQTSQQPPEAWLCFDLDTGAEPVRDPQLWARRSSTGSNQVVFEERKGAPYQMYPNPMPAAASRSADDDDTEER